MTVDVDALARAMSVGRLWPGAWDSMSDAERDLFKMQAEACVPYIARLLAEQREACARVAEDFEVNWAEGTGENVLAVAAAIRSRP